MSTWSLRAAMVPITRRVRAYFAPVNRQTETPSIFDPGKHGAFPLDAPPAPWFDLGWVDHFQRSCGTSTEALQASAPGTTVAQFRGPLSAARGIRFPGVGQTADGVGVGIRAHECSGQRSERKCAALRRDACGRGGGASGIDCDRNRPRRGAVNAFVDGDMVAVDADYQQQTGYVGTGIAAAYVNDPADVNHDPNYVRRVTFNLGRVAEKTATSLLLAQPLAGRSAGGGSGRAKSGRIRGPRGRIVLSGMVWAVRRGGGVRRANLLFLSAAKSDDDPDRDSGQSWISAGRGSGSDEADCRHRAAGGVRGAAAHR